MGIGDFETMISTAFKQHTLIRVTTKIICNSTSSNMKQVSHYPFSKKKKKKPRNFYYVTLTKTSPLQSFFNDQIFT